uniref:Uncharacterized protein n=1 Tax=Scleropages formosus TaxID=113540 RepID=A0A8C9QSL0_SCLFO
MLNNKTNGKKSSHLFICYHPSPPSQRHCGKNTFLSQTRSSAALSVDAGATWTCSCTPPPSPLPPSTGSQSGGGGSRGGGAGTGGTQLTSSFCVCVCVCGESARAALMENTPKCCVKVYLCSNPEDSEAEREALRETVFPRVRDRCRRVHGVEFRVIDPYEGVGHQSPPDPRTRLRLLDECRKSSAGPFFVVISI